MTRDYCRDYWQMLVQVDVGVWLLAHRRKHASRADSAVPHELQTSVEYPHTERHVDVGVSFAMHTS